MKKVLLFSSALLLSALVTNAQRYVNEVFTDADITVDANVTYGTNVNFLISTTSDLAQVQQDMTELKTAVALNQTIPVKFYNPADTSTDIKVSDMKMDIYYPDASADNETARPVVIYLHTGNFLPPPINGSPVGNKNDSTTVEMCKRWAKRGYVAVAMNYRLGWNPIASTVQERRGTLLNAVYRAIHDTKTVVRYLRDDANGSNMYGINPDQIVLYGEGTGAYISVAYATMDKYSEISLPKFTNPATQKSYIDTTLVGNLEGFGGALNLYVDNGFSSEISAVVTAGGALADTSWLEAGDAAMIAIQCIRDPFAPFDEGTVIVPTTMEDVVDVQGSNVYIQKANALGNNDELNSTSFIDPYSQKARSHYGQTYDYYLPTQNKITVGSNNENQFPVLLPLGSSQMTNQASPWQWWDPNSPQAKAEVAPGVTAHQASLSSNPDMSPEKGRAYLDTITNYMCPRIADLFGYYTNVNDVNISSGIEVFPNPSGTTTTISSLYGAVEEVIVMDIQGREIMRVAGENEKAVLDVQNLNNGIYILEVITEQGNGSARLIKN